MLKSLEQFQLQLCAEHQGSFSLRYLLRRLDVPRRCSSHHHLLLHPLNSWRWLPGLPLGCVTKVISSPVRRPRSGVLSVPARNVPSRLWKAWSKASS